eukprot:Em0002g1239a
MKTSIISNLQVQLQAKEEEIEQQKEISKLAMNNVEQLRKEKSDLIDSIEKLRTELDNFKLQNQTFVEDFAREREDRTLANKTVFEYAEELKELKELHKMATAQLKECKDELELTKEEVSVKVAQVKQYQKQVEAYKHLIQNENSASGHKGQTNKSGIGVLSLSSAAKENGTALTAECVSNGNSTTSPDVVASTTLCDAVGRNPDVAVQSELPTTHIEHQGSEELHIKSHNNSCDEKLNTCSLEESLPAPIYSQPNCCHPNSPAGLMAVASHLPQQCINSVAFENAAFSRNKQDAQQNGSNSVQEQYLPKLAPVYGVHEHSQYFPLHRPENADKVYPYSAGPNYDKKYSHGTQGKAEERNVFASITNQSDGVDSFIPYDPNLKCQFCQLCFRKGEIQLYRYHSQTCSSIQKN